MVRLTRAPIDFHALTESVRQPHCGAVALFLGTVRELTGDQVTVFLDYEAYGPMAENKLAEIEAEVRRRWPVSNIAMIHRLGRLAVGEVSVGVAVSSPHRAEAFDALRFAVDTLKELVPIWKKENAPDGTGEWVHQSAGVGCRVSGVGCRPEPLPEGWAIVTNRIPLSLSRDPRSPILDPRSGSLIDSFGRRHNNLRVSVTDRCNLRCTYCMPEDVVFRDRSELLTFEEIAQFVRVAATLGIDKVRLTGGEPLMRKDLHKLVRMVVGIPGIADVGLTTNGILLAEHAAELHAAGLRRLNVSLDTLDPGRFQELSRRPGVDRVLAGLDAAKRAGFDRIKVNAVAIRGFAEHDVVPLARYCRENGFEMRFIEYMPIGADVWERDKVFFAHEILELIGREVGELIPAKSDPTAPAVDYEYSDGNGRIGIIASVSRPFCRQCNRLRLTADGKIRNCLFALDESDAKALLRSGTAPDAPLADLIRRSVWEKWEGHEINTAKFVKPERTMHAIGG